MFVWLITVAGFGGAGCGLIAVGSGASANDPVPEGTLIAQGTFTGLNGKTTSGTAAIYLSSGGLATVRLESFSAPNGTSLQVAAKANGQTLYQASLRAESGNQNYATSVTGAQNWTSVVILSSTVASPLNEYGVALLENLND